MKVLHVIGGDLSLGASKGALILHNALIKEGINSFILNNRPIPKKIKNAFSTHDYFIFKFQNIIYEFLEKILKRFVSKKIITTFTTSSFGVDIRKYKIYQDADIIHFHWLGQGFINLKHINNSDKKIVWTLRDMWAFTGGCHYSLGCKKYENICGKCPVINSSNNSDITTIVQNKKLNFVKSNKQLQITTISPWLTKLAYKSKIFKNKKILSMGNNVEVEKFYPIKKDIARKNLGIKTSKKILVYGSQNPQDKRKGWNILLETLKKIDKKKYIILIFGNFWSHNELINIGIEFKIFGYVNDVKKLRTIYSSGDLYLAPAIEDGWPKSFAESLLCETPIVCFKNTSIGEVVKNGETGFVVKNFDSNKYRNCIEKTLKNVKKLKEVSKNGRNLIINHYSPSIIAKKYIKVYRELKN